VKVAILLGDGMADVPLPELDGKTPLEAAPTPHMDALAREGTLGLALTVPQGLPPGSDVASLSVFGYDPRSCYTGRAPLEAAAMGIDLGPDDIAFRMNLVTLLVGTGQVFLEDFSAGHISTAEAREVVATLAQGLGEDGLELYPGVSYRHVLVWRNGLAGARTTPPHDIQGQPIAPHLPEGEGAERLLHLITGSQILLKDHPVNVARRERGDKPANSIWLWGQGRRPAMESYRERFGLTGAVVSAVDLLKGIGRVAGLETPEVEGATGYIDTNYEGKVAAALEALGRLDFVFLHVEAPDEAGHAGRLDHKLQAIADFDSRVVGPVRRGLEAMDEDYALVVMPDHPTPISLRTHTRDAVPFAAYLSRERGGGRGARSYSELNALATGVHVREAHRLMDHIVGRCRLW
jgi:2,3-bisphosphoglycerate-independent phosphoglycerate mutase